MEPVEVGGWHYEPGVCLLADAYLLHHDPDIYPDPYAFRPERFLDEQPGTYTWIPFGGGRRRCLGASFAMLEMKIVLRAVLAQNELSPASAEAEGARRRSITLSPRAGARAVLRARQPARVPPRPSRSDSPEGSRWPVRVVVPGHRKETQHASQGSLRLMLSRSRPFIDELSRAIPSRPFAVELWDGSRLPPRTAAARPSRSARPTRSRMRSGRRGSSASAARTSPARSAWTTSTRCSSCSTAGSRLRSTGARRRASRSRRRAHRASGARRRCPRPSCARAGAGTARSGTRARCATTTTSRTTSSSSSSASRSPTAARSSRAARRRSRRRRRRSSSSSARSST